MSFATPRCGCATHFKTNDWMKNRNKVALLLTQRSPMLFVTALSGWATHHKTNKCMYRHKVFSFEHNVSPCYLRQRHVSVQSQNKWIHNASEQIFFLRTQRLSVLFATGWVWKKKKSKSKSIKIPNNSQNDHSKIMSTKNMRIYTYT